jgi:hypothetical protein
VTASIPERISRLEEAEKNTKERVDGLEKKLDRIFTAALVGLFGIASQILLTFYKRG